MSNELVKILIVILGRSLARNKIEDIKADEFASLSNAQVLCVAIFSLLSVVFLRGIFSTRARQ